MKAKNELTQKNEIYFALSAAIKILTYAHDSQSVSALIDLRVQAEKPFDFVFHRFPKSEQNRIVERMKALKESQVRENFTIPSVKEEN